MNEFRHCVVRIFKCQTIEDFREVLTGFSAGTWTLQERSVISAIYTPRLMKLLAKSEDAPVYLEELSALCWDRRVKA